MKKFVVVLIAIVVLASCGSPDAGLPLFVKKKTYPNALTYDKNLSEYTIVEIDQNILDSLVKQKSTELTLSIPYKDEILILELKEINLFDPTFKVNTTEGSSEYEKGLHYKGIIRGQAKSSVSMSIFKDEVVGVIISEKYGELNIGKSGMHVLSEYIVYDAEQLKDTVTFKCATPEKDPEELRLLKEVQKLVKKSPQAAINTCVTIDFEMAYSNYQNFGTSQAVINWITSIFANVKTIYKNEGIDVTIKSIFIHTAPDGYDLNPSTALNQLRNKRINDPNFTGSVVHLVRGKTSGFSGIAYVGVTCNNNYQYGLSDVQFSFNPYPTYSWTVMVLSHELGHNFGSPHTHSCTWPGGAIDNCYTTEGGCAPGPAPANGGTIMSYCHLTNYGIRLQNGFGPLPGAAIRNHIGAQACASGCTVAAPTCTDGIKNQNEWDIDCGGVCPPCPTCTDKIKNQNETGIDCGGVCPPCPVIPAGDPVVSVNKPAKQSTTYSSTYYPASKAFDGRSCPLHGANFNRTQTELQPWVEVDLGADHKVSKITITNRCDNYGNKLKRFKVFVSGQPVTSYSTTTHVYEANKPLGHANGEIITIPVAASGRYVRLWSDNTGYENNPLHVSEVLVQGMLATAVCDTFKVVSYRDSIVCH